MFVGAALVSGELFCLNGSLVLAIIVVTSLYSLLSLLDDYFDYTIDKKFASYRPLPSKTLTFFTYRFLYVLFAFIAVLGSFAIGRTFLIWFIIYSAASIFYSYNPPRITDRGLLGNLVLTLLTVTFPALMGAQIMGGLLGIRKIIIFALGASFIELAVDISKDFLEVRMSKETGRKTVVDQIGEYGAYFLSLTLIIVSFGLGLIALPSKAFSSIMLLVLSVILAVLFVHLARSKGVTMFKIVLFQPLVKIFKQEARIYRVSLDIIMGLYLAGFMVALFK